MSAPNRTNPRLGWMKDAKLEELLGERGPKDRHAIRHGEAQEVIERALYIANKNAIAEAKKAAAAAKSLYGSGSTTIADVQVLSTHTQAAPLTVLSDSVAGFEEGGFIASVSGYFDTTHHTADNDVFGNIILAIDGTDVAKQRIGIRTTGGSQVVTAMLPFHLTGTFDTLAVTPSIEIRAYSTLYNDEATASDSFYIREARLVISGIA